MQGFIPHDPPVFEQPCAIAHHEAAHAVLAYLYGFRIGPFRTFTIPGDITTGSLEAQPSSELADNLPKATTERVRQILAGEVAARVVTASNPDEVVLPLPSAPLVNESVSLEQINLALRGHIRTDMVRILGYMEYIGVINWWPWFWARHRETRELAERHWRAIQWLAQHFEQALCKPNRSTGSVWLSIIRFGPSFLRPEYWAEETSIVTAKWIIDHLTNLGVRPLDPDVTPVPCRGNPPMYGNHPPAR